MKGILKNIAGVFVETNEKASPQPVRKPPVNVNVVQEAVAPVYGNRLAPESEEFKKRFKAILEEENRRNHPGHDYFEFSEMVGAMTEIPQEPVRYRSAFAGWKMVGNQTKQRLLDTANIYLGLVDKEIKEFEAAYKTQYETQVGSNQKLIEQKRAQVAKMSEEIAKLNGEVLDLIEQNSSNTQNLTQKHDAFMAAGEAQRSEILAEIDKINQYIS